MMEYIHVHFQKIKGGDILLRCINSILDLQSKVVTFGSMCNIVYLSVEGIGFESCPIPSNFLTLGGDIMMSLQ